LFLFVAQKLERKQQPAQGSGISRPQDNFETAVSSVSPKAVVDSDLARGLGEKMWASAPAVEY